MHACNMLLSIVYPKESKKMIVASIHNRDSARPIYDTMLRAVLCSCIHAHKINVTSA